ELRRHAVLGVDAEHVAPVPRDLDAERAHELDERLDVADARDVLEHHRLVREQRAGDDGQRRVLVPGGSDGPGERLPSLDDELYGVTGGHGGGLGADEARWRTAYWRHARWRDARCLTPSGRAE